LTNKTLLPIDAKIVLNDSNDNYDFSPINRVITCYAEYVSIHVLKNQSFEAFISIFLGLEFDIQNCISNKSLTEYIRGTFLASTKGGWVLNPPLLLFRNQSMDRLRIILRSRRWRIILNSLQQQMTQHSQT